MKRVVFFTTIIIAVILLHFLGILSPIEKIVLRLATPISSAFQGAFNFFSGNYEDYLSKEELENENKRLRERIKELLVERAEINILQQENTSLKKMLSFLEEKKYEGTTARIIGKTAEGDVGTIVINRGYDDGVLNNAPVITQSGILIGKVIKTTANNATVLLLSDGSSEIAGMIQNKGETIGVVKGGYGLGIRMELIPQTEEIKTDEIVVTSGLELEIPKGLLIGTVESVIKEENTPFQTITIKPLLNYEKLDFVSVLSI